MGSIWELLITTKTGEPTILFPFPALQLIKEDSFVIFGSLACAPSPPSSSSPALAALSSTTSMHLDKESALKTHRKKRRSSCLPCFLGSPVSDSDVAETPPAASAARFGRRRSGWFSYPRLGKKKEKKKTENTVAIDAPAKAKAGTEAIPAAEEKLSDESPAAQSGHEGKSSGREEQRQQTSPSGPPSTNHRPVRTRSKSNDPKSREAASSSRSARTGAVGPLVGAAVMAVTLAILAFAGRVTAVICMCSCLFIIQFIRAPPSSSDGGEIAPPAAVDVDSDEYKKRVILEGLLERNSRRPAAVGFSAAPPIS